MNNIRINTKNLQENINYLKKEYPFTNYILDVSNNAFNHGMYIINYLTEYLNYLYVNSFNDVYLIRKFNKNIPIILNTYITKEHIYDVINQNVILIISNLEELKIVMNTDLYAELKIILQIDINEFRGFKNYLQIHDALTIIEATKRLELVGIISFSITEKNYPEFLDTIKDLLNLNLELYLFNNEIEKKRIKNSNAILLDTSIYGLNNKKKKFGKEKNNLKQVFSLETTIINIKKEINGKKVKYLGIIPLGSNNGIAKVTKVIINNELFSITEVNKDYSLILINEEIKVLDIVTITSDKNSLENYFSDNFLTYIGTFGSNLPIIYNEDYILEKTYCY